MSGDGERIITGSTISNAGVAFIYERNDGQWTQIGKTLLGDDPTDQAGYAVAISEDGSHVVLGSGANSKPGYARVYSLDEVSTSVHDDHVTAIQIAPNPSSDYLTLLGLPQSNYEVLLIDLKGAVIRAPINDNVIDVSHLHTGI